MFSFYNQYLHNAYVFAYINTYMCIYVYASVLLYALDERNNPLYIKLYPYIYSSNIISLTWCVWFVYINQIIVFIIWYLRPLVAEREIVDDKIYKVYLHAPSSLVGHFKSFKIIIVNCVLQYLWSVTCELNGILKLVVDLKMMFL